MRIDLIFDFQHFLKTFFLEFVKNYEINLKESKASFSLDFIHFKGDSIFKGCLYFCCQKSYFNLSSEVFEQVAEKNCLVFNRYNNQWEACVNIFDKSLIKELSDKYRYRGRDIISIVDYSYLKNNIQRFYIGFCIDGERGHQVFYIWDYRVQVEEEEVGRRFLYENDKLYVLKMHKRYIEFVRDRKLISQSTTVNDFYRNEIINRKTFQKKFKELLGTTFYDYYLQMRLLTVLKELLATDRPIKSIYMDVGYSDYSVLLKAFRQKQFLSPSLYRTSYFYK